MNPEELWIGDLDAFLKELDKQDEKDASQTEVATKGMGGGNRGAKATRQVKNPKKNNTKKISDSETVAGSVVSDNSTTTEIGVEKPKGKGRAKKAAPEKKKPTPVDSDEDDEELAELKERLAAYNIDSPSDKTEMETEEPSKKKEPTKRAASKKPPSAFTEISDDEYSSIGVIPEEEEDDEDFELDSAPKGGKRGGGRKAANPSKPAAAPGRKRGVNNKALLSQKLMTDMLKPAAEKAMNSPDKKVRKMRASPFNKKSGSILASSMLEKKDEDVEELSEVPAAVVEPRARPQRANRVVQTRYVLTDSEEEEESETEEFSDFEEEED